MSFSIDHAAFMTQFAEMWDLLNYHAYLASAMTLFSGAGIMLILKNMFTSQQG